MRIKKTKISYLVEIPQITDEGFLCFAEGQRDVPFAIKRVYYIFDTKQDAPRGFHAHKKTLQVLFCIRGSVKIILDNGFKKEEVFLDKPNKGVFLDKMIWHEILDFKKETVLLIFASDFYKEKDYIRNYQNFLKASGTKLRKVVNHPTSVVLDKPIERVGLQ